MGYGAPQINHEMGLHGAGFDVTGIDISEATVVNNGYSGQYFSSGANVNYVSKSGSNKYHGNASWLWNGTSMNANGYFNKQNSPPTPRGFVNDNQWAASFGGPIKKDKTFFFVSYEYNRRNDFGTVFTNGVLPSEEGAQPKPFRNHLLTAKSDFQLNDSNRLLVRWNSNASPLPRYSDSKGTAAEITSFTLWS